MLERGATEDEVVEAIKSGDIFEAKQRRTGFKREFPGTHLWGNLEYRSKAIEVIAVPEESGWLVITVLVKYSRE